MAAPPEEAPPGVPEWVVTYGDMMSLLLTFFIMLVSMSQLKDDSGKTRAMMDAIRQSFGPAMGRAGAPGTSLQWTSADNKLFFEGGRNEGGTKRTSRDSKGRAGAFNTVSRINHGTVVTMGGPSLFERFSAELTDAAKANLEVIAEVLSSKPNRLVVRGHATPEPLPHGSQYRDQLDLSFARAHAASEFLSRSRIPSYRLVVSAAGDSEPRMLSREPEAQRRNRRVDVFLIDSYISRPDAGAVDGGPQ